MVISDKYKYLFIQNAFTASSSMQMELIKNYGGESILWKHARYEDFLKIASPEQKRYFVFIGKRNPLDMLVTAYLKSKYGTSFMDERGNYVEKEMILGKSLSMRRDIIREKNLSFPDFFYLFYSQENSLSFKNKNLNESDFVYRYESLQEDFSEILKRLGINQVRPLPQYNKTLNKKKNFLEYYTFEMQPIVMSVFKDSMNSLGYEFPASWKKLDE